MQSYPQFINIFKTLRILYYKGVKAISVKNVSFSYENAPETAVNDVSFELEKGSYTALVGLNGSGKSTLAKILAGIIEPDSGSIEKSRSAKIGIVFQSPKNQIICGTVRKDVAFGPVTEGLPQSEVELRLIEGLSAVNLLHCCNSRVQELSLGQEQKLAFSSILALNPEILILDEAVAMLDPAAKEEIFKLLDDLNAKGTTVIHITHELYGVKRASDVLVMRKGKIVWGGKSRAFFSEKALVSELSGEPLVKEKRRNAEKKVPVSLSVSNLSFGYGTEDVLKNLSFEVEAGSLVALTGASGSGKSTLLEILSGLLKPASGTVSGVCRPVLCQQNCDAALFENFAADDVAFGLRNSGIKGRELARKVRSAMEAVNLPYDEYADRQTYCLSGGEKKRLAVAGIIALDSDILLFDEPCAALDGQTRNKVMTLMRSLADQGKTVIFSTHNMEEASFADHVLHIENGNILPGYCGRKSREFVEPVRLSEINILPNLDILDGFRKVVFGGKTASGLISRVPSVLRILLFICFFTGIIIVGSFKGLALLLALSVMYGLFSGIRSKNLFARMAQVLPFLLFFAVFQILFGAVDASDSVIFEFKWICITREKLLLCLKVLFRTECALGAVWAYVTSVSEDDLIAGITKLLSPLKFTGIPVRDIFVLMEIIFRFVPLLVEEAVCIVKTQLIRGGLGRAKGFMNKIRAFLPLIVPLIIQTLKRAEALADALTARGYK